MIESDATRLIRILWQQQELIEFLLDNRNVIELHDNFNFKQEIAKLEKTIITEALSKTNGNVVRAAKNLNMVKTSLYDKIKQHNLEHLKRTNKKNETTNTKSN